MKTILLALLVFVVACDGGPGVAEGEGEGEGEGEDRSCLDGFPNAEASIGAECSVDADCAFQDFFCTAENGASISFCTVGCDPANPAPACGTDDGGPDDLGLACVAIDDNVFGCAPDACVGVIEPGG